MRSRNDMSNQLVVFARNTRLSFRATILRLSGSSCLQHLGKPSLTELCF